MSEDLKLIEEIKGKLELDFVTTAEYENELRTHSRFMHELDRLYRESQREVNNKKLRLEIIAAEVMRNIIENYEKNKGKDFPQSSMQEVRKSQVPLNEKYIVARRELNDAVDTMNNLEGLRLSWKDRGYRLNQLGRFIEDTLIKDKMNIRPSEKKLNKIGNKLKLGDEAYA